MKDENKVKQKDKKMLSVTTAQRHIPYPLSVRPKWHHKLRMRLFHWFCCYNVYFNYFEYETVDKRKLIESNKKDVDVVKKYYSKNKINMEK